ncbi:MAG: hypothetical protein U0132_22085 [Gemmatimonadaceae bacterium]
MTRIALGAQSRHLAFAAGCLLLLTGAPHALRAQGGSTACKLMQVSELESALRAKATNTPGGEKQSAPGLTVDECSVVLASANTKYPVSIRVVSGLGMDGAQALTARNTGTAREAQWKQPGAHLEQTTIGKALCILSGRPNVASHAICSIPKGDGYLELDVTGPVAGLPTLAAVGALVQKASSRQ